MSYASAKGKTPHFEAQKRKPPRELSDGEKAEIAEKVRALKAKIPEAMDLIKAWHEEGLVDGLRCIAWVRNLEREEHGLDG